MSRVNSYLKWAGWCSTWNAEDRKEVTEHHRRLYRELKREHGNRMTPAHEIPGLLEGVESLLEYGYSLTDIGAMIGLSRERVRQWVERYDLNRPYHDGARYRMWDDERNQFVPVEHEDMREQARLAYLERREKERTHEMALRWNEAVTVARNMALETGRAPTLSAVARRALGRPGDDSNQVIPVLLGSLNGGDMGNGNHDSYAEVTRHLFKLAGLPAPQAGSAGRPEQRPLVVAERP